MNKEFDDACCNSPRNKNIEKSVNLEIQSFDAIIEQKFDKFIDFKKILI